MEKHCQSGVQCEGSTKTDADNVKDVTVAKERETPGESEPK